MLQVLLLPFLFLAVVVGGLVLIVLVGVIKQEQPFIFWAGVAWLCFFAVIFPIAFWNDWKRRKAREAEEAAKAEKA